MAAALALLANLAFDATVDLRPVMPEVDGVHPVRGVEALETAWVPGGGFRDKYPPLGSALLGLAARAADPALRDDSRALTSLPEDQRRLALWELRDRIAAALVAERWLSRLAACASVAVLALLAAAVARRAGAGASEAGLAGLLAAAGFGASYPLLYYGSSTNVDTLALLAALLALLAACSGRWMAAAAGAAVATAIKDPLFVLGPLVLAGALADGAGTGRARRLRRAAGAVAVGLLVYGLLAGAFTGPAVWREHVAYILTGGVAGPDRIDHAQPGHWLALLLRCPRLVAGAIGWTGLALGAFGLARLLRGDRRSALVLLGVVAVTVLLFVLPVGFVYARFLLLPMAALLVGAGVVVARLAVRAWAPAADGRRRAAVLLAALAGAVLLLDRDVLDWHCVTARSPDARRLAADELPGLVPDGASIAVFADEREHAVPLDPGRWPQQSHGLVDAEARLMTWSAAGGAPDWLLWMSFPIDRTSGLPSPPVVAPRVGDKLVGLYEVAAVWGAPTGAVPEGAVPVRPMVTLLRRGASGGR